LESTVEPPVAASLNWVAHESGRGRIQRCARRGEPYAAQRADSNIGLEGGHGGLVDSVLGTPNRKTPVPQDDIFATAPGAQQTAPMPQSNTKAIGTPRIINRIFPEAHQ